MGYNTVLLVLNDVLGDIQRDAEFGKKVADAVRAHVLLPRENVDVTGYGGGVSVISQAHSDTEIVLAVGGNTARRLSFGRWTDSNLIFLKRMADELGYDLHKRASSAPYELTSDEKAKYEPRCEWMLDSNTRCAAAVESGRQYCKFHGKLVLLRGL